MNQTTNRPWEDTSLSDLKRASALMAEMSLEEKVGQLGSIWIGFSIGVEAESDTDNVPAIVEVAQPLSWDETVKHGLGHFTRW